MKTLIIICATIEVLIVFLLVASLYRLFFQKKEVHYINVISPNTIKELERFQNKCKK